LQKALCRRWQFFSIAVCAASAALYTHLIASMRIRSGGGELYLGSARLGFAFNAIGIDEAPKIDFASDFELVRK
jgi:hypothetical protein